MKKEAISERQEIILMILFILGSTLLTKLQCKQNKMAGGNNYTNG